MKIHYLSRTSLIRGPIDSSFLVVALMLEQLYKDARSNQGLLCETLDGHKARDCALTILHHLNSFRRDNPGADHIDIALELLRLHSPNGYVYRGSTT